MPDYTKISELPAGSSAAATDQMEVNQSGTSRRLTLEQAVKAAGATATNAQGSIGASNVVCGVGPTAVCNTGSIGANGQVWEIIAKASYCEIGGGAGGYWGLDIWNGSVAVDNASNYLSVSGGQQCSTLMAIVTLTAATTFSLRLNGPSSFANGLANCCRITAKRLA